jgi:Uma2 family endonuclease
MVTLPKELKDAPDLPLLIKASVFQLENEALARNEFRNWLTPDIKAEFINGEKIVHSPARDLHNCAVFWLASILKAHTTRNALGRIYVEKTLIGLSRNDYEPDIAFFRAEQVKSFGRNHMIYPAPDLIVEVLSESTFKVDRGIKFRDYAAHGLPEYWIVDADHESVERYENDHGSYVLQPNKNDLIQSPQFPGLEIPLKAIFDETANHEFLTLLYERPSDRA